MSNKRFRKSPGTFEPIAVGFGSCYASDRITVDGCRVGYMYREAPDGKSSNTADSGWRFFAGDESDEYCSVPANFEIYDVNTIANYDPEITPHLHAEVGSAFSREADVGFVRVPFDPPNEH
ncbi:MAG: DUF2185 domain-containing protein [Steroidobacteraceae bacterium]